MELRTACEDQRLPLPVTLERVPDTNTTEQCGETARQLSITVVDSLTRAALPNAALTITFNARPTFVTEFPCIRMLYHVSLCRAAWWRRTW